jgi:hypothetical protein
MARQWLGSGVLRGLYSELAPSYAASVITTQAGAVWIDGHYAEIAAVANTPVTANGLLVVRFTPADNKFELLFRDGVTVPTQTTATWELPIALMTAGAMRDQRPFVGPAGGMTKLAEAVVTAPTANVDFQNIPLNYRHLRISYLARGDGGATVGILLMRFNGDATANYDYQGLLANNGAVTNSQGAAQTFLRAGNICQNLAAATEFAAGDIEIPYYAGIVASKAFSAKSAGPNITVATSFVSVFGGSWRPQNQVSRITLLPDAGNFVAGSLVTLYGLA